VHAIAANIFSVDMQIFFAQVGLEPESSQSHFHVAGMTDLYHGIQLLAEMESHRLFASCGL
jgi:hypothetical protein